MKSELDLARQCPRFDTCSVNRCPLDKNYPNQPIDRNEKEKRCAMERAVRVRIGASAPGVLKLAGLTVAEHAATLAFERKPVEVRLAMAEMGKASLARLRSSNKLKNLDEC